VYFNIDNPGNSIKLYDHIGILIEWVRRFRIKIRKARQILKSFADDTRLRIINLLHNKKDISVGEMCEVLDKNQPNISKHLTRLRLTGVVGDIREGNNVRYFLARPTNTAHRELVKSIIKGLAGLPVFKEDIDKLNKLRDKDNSKKKRSKK